MKISGEGKNVYGFICLHFHIVFFFKNNSLFLIKPVDKSVYALTTRIYRYPPQMNTEKTLDKILGSRCMACAHFSHENFKFGDRLEEGRKLHRGICAPGYCVEAIRARKPE